MPEVSVIIPVYNSEKYLAPCLDSVCSQTLRDIEIICINDGSTDHSLQMLWEYAERDSRIRVIDLQTNRGASEARNAGIAAAKGKYIGFVDSDDRVEKDFFENLYAKVQTNADIIKGVLRRSSNDSIAAGYLDTAAECFDDIDQIRACKGNFFFYFYTAIYKRTLLTDHQIQFPPRLKYGEDLCFGSKAAVLANKIETVPDAYYYYTDNEASVINTIAKNSFAYLHSHMLMTDEILDGLDRYCTDDKEYCAVVCKLLICIHFVSGNLHVMYREMQIEEQWMKYVLGRCRFRDKINQQYYAEIAKMQERIKTAQLAMARKKMEQHRK